jgi:hypothetical protein
MAVGRGACVWLVVLGVLAIPSARAEECVAPAPAQSGMQAHVDPDTGRLVPEPVVPPPSRPEPPAPPLAPEPAPGGGMMIRLKGRFMSTLVATAGPDGNVHVGCVTGDGHTVHPGD